MDPKHKNRLLERRERLQQAIEAKKLHLLKRQEKKEMQMFLNENQEAAKKITSLEEKVASLEKIVNQLKLDFSRYRARNK